MNLWISAAPFNPSTGPTNAIAVRKRLMNPVVRERKPVASCVAEPVLIRAITIDPNVPRHDHDAHVRAWHVYLFDMANPCKAHIRTRCAELGVSYEDVIGPCRDKQIYKIRDMVIFEIKTDVKPGISYPELGRLFGKDHTSTILSYHRHAARLGDPDSAARIERKRAESRRGHEVRKAKAA